MQKNLFLVCNSGVNTSNSIGGGDVILIESYKRIQHHFKFIDSYCSGKIKKLLGPHIKACYKISPGIFDRFPLIISYMLRTLTATWFMLFQHRQRIDFIYACSDFFPDVIPSYVYALFHPHTKWVQCIFHLYPDWKNRPGSKFKNFVMYYLQRVSFFFIKRRADKLVILNELVRTELITRGFQKEKLSILPGGIDMDYFEPIRPDNKTKSYSAVFLGRIHETKGVFDLIHIWKKVIVKSPMITLAIIGNGDPSTVQKMKDLISYNNLHKNIDMLGFLSKKETVQIIKKSNMFVFPSHEEGFGIVITEAIACKVPVITWNLAVFDSLFPHCLFTVKEGDISEFASEVIRVYTDENLRNSKIQEARSYIKKYDWNRIALDHLQLYV